MIYCDSCDIVFYLPTQATLIFLLFSFLCSDLFKDLAPISPDFLHVLLTIHFYSLTGCLVFLTKRYKLQAVIIIKCPVALATVDYINAVPLHSVTLMHKIILPDHCPDPLGELSRYLRCMCMA